MDVVNDFNTQNGLLFRSLHDPKNPLVLSNVWDVASAVITEAAGARALATTSAGLAWSLGFPDGDEIAPALAIDAIARIAAAVSIPVTADIEGGYAESPSDVEGTVSAVLEAGAVGVNIEDGQRAPFEAGSRVAAARRAADRAGVPLFINARTDVFLAGIGGPDGRVAEALHRAARYVDAGADGVFIPGVTDPDTIASLVAGISVPVNIMAGPGAPSVGELGRLGVARVSLGSAVAQAAYAHAARAATELMTEGTYSSLADAVDYGALNNLLTQAHARPAVV